MNPSEQVGQEFLSRVLRQDKSFRDDVICLLLDGWLLLRAECNLALLDLHPVLLLQEWQQRKPIWDFKSRSANTHGALTRCRGLLCMPCIYCLIESPQLYTRSCRTTILSVQMRKPSRRELSDLPRIPPPGTRVAWVQSPECASRVFIVHFYTTLSLTLCRALLDALYIWKFL